MKQLIEDKKTESIPTVEDAKLFLLYETANSWLWVLGADIAYKLMVYKVNRKLRKYRKFKENLLIRNPKMYNEIFRFE